jgi:glycosyltransferase involved in cell wall biosynthesis
MTPPPEPAVWFPAIRAGSGTDVFTERLAAGLQRRGIRTEITWLPHRAEYAPWMIAKPKPPAWANIAHVNTWLPARLLPQGMPVVATMHSNVHIPELTRYKNNAKKLYHRFRVKRTERETMRRADTVVAVSRFIADQAKVTLGRELRYVIFNGISMSGPFIPVDRKEPSCPFRLLFVGHWSILKGVDLLFPILDQLGTDFELAVTVNRDKITTPVPASAKVRFLGHLSEQDVSKQYRLADALLFPSHLEGFGLVTLEAQACGLPVIATSGSAFPEVIEDGVTGILCPQNDIDAFANAARKLAADHKLWQSMCAAARARARNYFGIEKMIEAYLAVYQNTLNDSQNRRTDNSIAWLRTRP